MAEEMKKEDVKEEVKEEETVEGMQSHEENDGHEDEIEYDEHVWLSVKNAKTAVTKIAEYLEVLDLANSSVYAKNLQNYLEKLDSLSEIATELSKKNDFSSKPLIFCDRFPFRYMTDELGAKYFAAFSGCSAETEASFETVENKKKKVPLKHIEPNKDKPLIQSNLYSRNKINHHSDFLAFEKNQICFLILKLIIRSFRETVKIQFPAML